MNEIILMGYLGRDPELRYASNENQTAVCRFSLAVQKDYVKEKAADWFSCVAFGAAAENISKYFRKGSRILINGRVQTGTYEDNEGVTRAKFDVMIKNFEFVDKKSENGDAAPKGSGKQQNAAQKQQKGGNDKYYDMPPIDEEDLPF